MKKILLTGMALFAMLSASAQKEPVDYVNPFIGTTNYGTDKRIHVIHRFFLSRSRKHGEQCQPC